MQLLTDKQINEINILQQILNTTLSSMWNEVRYGEHEDISIYLASKKLQMILIERITVSLDLISFRGHLPSSDKEKYDGYYSETEFSNCIMSFYSHIMNQLGYECNEVDVDDVICTYSASQVEDCENLNHVITELAEEYGVDESYIELLVTGELSGEVVDSTLYIWSNNLLNKMLSVKPELWGDEFFNNKIKIITEPIFLGYEHYNGVRKTSGKLMYHYLLGNESVEKRFGVNGLDYFLTDVLDAILLHDYIQKF